MNINRFKDNNSDNIINKAREYFKDLLQNCEKFIVNTERHHYVYKKCKPHWLVILKKCQNTITNENRCDVYDDQFAEFRASELKVIAIINIYTISTIDIITSVFINKQTIYKVNEYVVADDFDFNIDQICSSGIHYYKSPIPAICHHRQHEMI